MFFHDDLSKYERKICYDRKRTQLYLFKVHEILIFHRLWCCSGNFNNLSTLVCRNTSTTKHSFWIGKQKHTHFSSNDSLSSSHFFSRFLFHETLDFISSSTYNRSKGHVPRGVWSENSSIQEHAQTYGRLGKRRPNINERISSKIIHTYRKCLSKVRRKIIRRKVYKQRKWSKKKLIISTATQASKIDFWSMTEIHANLTLIEVSIERSFI